LIALSLRVFGIVSLLIDFLGVSWETSLFLRKFLPLIGKFCFGFECFCYQRVLFPNSRADIATLFFGFLSIASVNLTVALTWFSETARFIRVLPRWYRARASLCLLSSRLCTLFPR